VFFNPDEVRIDIIKNNKSVTLTNCLGQKVDRRIPSEIKRFLFFYIEKLRRLNFDKGRIDLSGFGKSGRGPFEETKAFFKICFFYNAVAIQLLYELLYYKDFNQTH